MKTIHLYVLLAALSFPQLLSAQQFNFPNAKDPTVKQSKGKGIEGTEAPPFGGTEWIQLPEGRESLEISDFAGKYLVMMFFQDTCEACHKRSFPTLKRLVDKFGDEEGVAFLAIQTPFEDFTDNTKAKLAPTAEKFGLDIPFGHLAKTARLYSLNSAYNTGGTPWWVIVDKEGVVIYDGHYLNPDEAEKNLENLLAGKPID